MNETQITDITNLIGTCVVTIIGYISAQKWLWPLIVKCWDWVVNRKREFDDRQISLSDEITKLKINDVERYEKTFNTLLNQISDLEEELKKYSKELQELRNTILKLNSKLYEKALIISDLQKYTCKKAKECELREICEVNHIEKLIEDEE